MPSYSDVRPLIDAHCLALQTYLETANDDPEKDARHDACLETARQLADLFDEPLAPYVSDVMVIVVRLAVHEIHNQPGVTLEAAFEQQLHEQAKSIGVEERLIYRHASKLTDAESDPTTKTLAESFGVFFETIFRALRAVLSRPFNKEAFQDYRNYLNDAWGFNHQSALKELSEILKTPKHSNVVLPNNESRLTPMDPFARQDEKSAMHQASKPPSTTSTPSDEPSSQGAHTSSPK